MRTRDEVLLGFGFPLFTEKDIDAAIYSMADRIRELEQEHHEDQGVITVLRGRIERQDTRISKLKRERDEARRDRDQWRVRSTEHQCNSEQWHSRAERAERVVEAARKWLADLWRGDLNGTVIGVCMEYEPDGQYALWEQVAPIAEAVRALDAAEGTP